MCYLKIFENVIYSCNGKAEFSASLLQTLSHDPLEIILICWFCYSRNISYYYRWWWWSM